MKQNVIYLQVPYSEKETAKSLGARWDPKEKLWFVPAGIDMENFTKWLPEARFHKQQTANS